PTSRNRDFHTAPVLILQTKYHFISDLRLKFSTDFSALRTNRAALWTTMLGAILNLSLLTRNRYSMISSNQTGAGAHDETLAAATKVSAPFAWLPARGTNSPAWSRGTGVAHR